MNLTYSKGQNAKSIVIFDGNCQLCNSSVRFLRRADKASKLIFLPSQRLYLHPELLAIIAPQSILPNTLVVVSQEGQVLMKFDAVIYALKVVGWRFLWVLRVVPRFVRDGFYDLVARNRYRLFGRANSCSI